MATPLPSQGDLDYLNKAITAVNSLDPQPWFDAATGFTDAAGQLLDIADAVDTRAARLLQGEGGVPGWTGEGAEAFTRIVKDLTGFLRELAMITRSRDAPARAAGEDILELKRAFDALLRANAVNFDAKPPPPPEPVVPMEAYIA
ncbi:hypothetical protein ABT354_16725 [Streptomyces sp. NPDC000594]|uniref:hypothetical protein n=1 Tax=Streptomyces sp. NPDC000594 TaxID=3154261 RepID=UPI003324063D